MGTDDRAILVGIQSYSDSAFGPLNGPLNDVDLMKCWLESPEGGNLSPNQIEVLQSVQPAPAVPADQMPPLAEQFLQVFRRLAFGPGGPIYRPQSRLYLYFSGHGFSQLRDAVPRAALYAANATRYVPENIAGTCYAEYARNAALFREVVIVMDCCRGAESAQQEAVPPLLDIQNVGAAATAQIFGVYAAPKGGAAQERPIASRGNRVHGLLTHALVAALGSAPVASDGAVTTDDVSSYLRASWAVVCGDRPADPPEFTLPTLKPFALCTRPGVLQQFRVAGWSATEVIELLDGRLSQLARLTRNPDGLTVTVTWASGSVSTSPLTADIFSLELPGGLFLVRRGTHQRPFLAGQDVIDA